MSLFVNKWHLNSCKNKDTCIYVFIWRHATPVFCYVLAINYNYTANYTTF